MKDKKDKAIYAVLRHKVYHKKITRWEKLVDVTRLDIITVNKYDEKQLNMTIIFDNAQFEIIVDDFTYRGSKEYQILTPDGYKLEFDGFLSEIPMHIDADGVFMGDILFEVDGPFKMDTLFKMPVLPVLSFWERLWLRIVRFLKSVL